MPNIPDCAQSMVITLLVLGLPLDAADPPQITTPVEVKELAPASKIAQIVGDLDRQSRQPTENLTLEHYRLPSTDLGVSFQHRDRTYVAFGDVPGSDRDPLAFSEDTDPENGLGLRFLTNADGTWRPITIPGIRQAAFEVPVEGISLNGAMYLWHTTDSVGDRMGRSVLARSDDDGANFRLVRTFSIQHFINVSVVAQRSGDWPGSPELEGQTLFVFGSGAFRKSDVRLGFLPSSQIESAAAMKYFAGLFDGLPRWSISEHDALPLFKHPVVGELSVTYDEQLKRWLMLYNASEPRGIVLRTAINPWGPWSEPRVIFDPGRDRGYCHFIHSNWQVNRCDNVHDSGRENEWGGEYAPYMLRHFSKTIPGGRRIYFTMSTWNPYTVVLMKADLTRQTTSSVTRPALTAAPSAESKHFVVSWESTAHGWFLESRRSLSPSEPWKRFPYAPSSSNSRIRVSIDPGPTGAFFRLVRP